MLQFDSFVIIFAAIVQVFKGGKLFKWGNYSGEETIQGRKLLMIRSFWPRKLFKGGKYSREETIWGNTVVDKFFITKINCKNENFTFLKAFWGNGSKQKSPFQLTLKRNIVIKLELLTPQGLYFLGCILRVTSSRAIQLNETVDEWLHASYFLESDKLYYK